MSRMPIVDDETLQQEKPITSQSISTYSICSNRLNINIADQK